MVDGWLPSELRRRGISRRDFVGFCATMAAALALPKRPPRRFARRRQGRKAGAHLARVPGLRRKHRVVPEGQPSDRRRGHPRRAVGRLSRDDHGGGRPPGRSRTCDDAVKERAGAYIAVVEGSIPTGANGAYCTIGGRAALDIAREVCGSAAATIAIGTCAAFGGLPAAAPNPTGALGVADAVPGVKNLINLSACPGQRREPDGAARLLPHVQAVARRSITTGGRCSPTASRFTTTASGARTTTPASTSRRGATRATARATASTRWAARARSRSRTVRTSAGTAARTGRSAAAIRASAAPSRTSGTR